MSRSDCASNVALGLESSNLREHARYYADRNQIETAVFFAERLVASPCEILNEDVLFCACLLQRSDQHFRAVSLLNRFPDAASSSRGRIVLAQSHAALGEWDSVKAVLDRFGDAGTQRVLLSDDIPLDRPHPADVALSFTLLAQAAIYREDRSGAAQHLRQALQADPCCVEAFRLMKRGGLVSGSEIRADLLQLDVSPDRAWVSDIFCCLADPCASTSSGMPPAAAADALTHHLILACTAYDSRDWNTTVNETSAILEVDRLHPDALLVHLGALTNARRVPELYQAAHQLAKITPKSAIAWYAVGCYYLASDQPEPARRYLVKACLADPLFVHAHIAVGLAHTAAHEGDQALQCFRESSRLFPGAHVANIAMGRELLRTGSPQLAERMLRSAQAPGDSHVLNDLGVSLYEQGRLDAALSVFSQGLSLCRATFRRPRDDNVFVALCINAAHALRRLGRNGEALVLLEEAVAAGSGAERVNARTTMGLVLLLMGRADAAVDVLHANLSGTLDLPQTNQACSFKHQFVLDFPYAEFQNRNLSTLLNQTHQMFPQVLALAVQAAASK